MLIRTSTNHWKKKKSCFTVKFHDGDLEALSKQIYLFNSRSMLITYQTQLYSVTEKKKLFPKKPEFLL